MRRKVSLIFLTCAILVIAGALLWRWQMSKFGSAFQSLPVHSMETASLASLASVALDRSVLADLGARDDKPLIDKYRENSAAVEQQAKFVTTWVNANRAIGYLGQSGISPGSVVNLSELQEIPARYRIDAWDEPFCGVVDDETAILMSSGGHGQLACDHLQQIATEARKVVQTKKLVKLKEGVFVVVRRNWKSSGDQALATKQKRQKRRV
jgi:hypothetical protein